MWLCAMAMCCLIPKKENYVLVSGQVFNQTAISYRPGRARSGI